MQRTAKAHPALLVLVPASSRPRPRWTGHQRAWGAFGRPTQVRARCWSASRCRRPSQHQACTRRRQRRDFPAHDAGKPGLPAGFRGSRWGRSPPTATSAATRESTQPHGTLGAS